MSRNGDATRARIYDAVRTLTAQHRRPPTVRQIAAHCQLSSSGHVYWCLDELRRQGLIEPSDGHAGILLTQEHS